MLLQHRLYMSNNFKNLLINMKVAHKSDLCYYIRNFKEKRRKNGRIICGICKESEGKYKCAVVNEEGNEKHKFTIELSQGDLQDMTEDIIFRDKITQDTLYRDLKEAIIALIIEKCEEFSRSENESQKVGLLFELMNDYKEYLKDKAVVEYMD